MGGWKYSLYRSFCMASKNNFPHAYLMEHVRCTFCSVVHLSDSSLTIKSLVKILSHPVLLICNTSTVLKFCHSQPFLPLEVLLLFSTIMGSLAAFFHLRFKSHGDFSKLWFYSKLLDLIVFQHVPVKSARSAEKIKFLEQNNCLHRSIKLHNAGQKFQLVVPWSVKPDS